MMRISKFAALGLWLIAAAAWGETGAVDRLLERLAGFTQLQGKFTQRQYGEGDTLLAQSSGSFRLLRPGYFAWEIESPDRQLIIADPRYLWHYDRDLETVTRRPVSGREEMLPLQVLGGDETALRERFTVEQRDAGSFILTPVAGGDPGFKRLTLQFDAETIRGMEILDRLNQRVQIDFREVQTDRALTPADFAFTPPQGADVFYYDD
jgi:outer membrane lipoprotein carrier protein